MNSLDVTDALDSPDSLMQWRAGALDTASEFDMNKLARQLHTHYQSLKLRANHRLKRTTMSFGLIRSYFETIWEQLEEEFTRI